MKGNTLCEHSSSTSLRSLNIPLCWWFQKRASSLLNSVVGKLWHVCFLAWDIWVELSLLGCGLLGGWDAPAGSLQPWRGGNAVLSAAALWLLQGCAVSCLWQHFASWSSFWLVLMCHKASGCTQLKMLFNSSAGLRRKACADVSNSGRHDFPDIRKTSLPAWQSTLAAESLRSLLFILSMYCFSWKLKPHASESQGSGRNPVEELCKWCQGHWEVLKILVLAKWTSPWFGLFIGFRKDYRNGKILNLFTLSCSILSKIVFLLWSGDNRKKKKEWVCWFSLESSYQFAGNYVWPGADIWLSSQDKSGFLNTESLMR